MARIAPEDMTTLITASEANTVALTAATDVEEMTVAHAINEAANCGETSVMYPRPISDTVLTKLKGNGYTITTPRPIAKPGDVIIISWKDVT